MVVVELGVPQARATQNQELNPIDLAGLRPQDPIRIEIAFRCDREQDILPQLPPPTAAQLFQLDGE